MGSNWESTIDLPKLRKQMRGAPAQEKKPALFKQLWIRLDKLQDKGLDILWQGALYPPTDIHDHPGVPMPGLTSGFIAGARGAPIKRRLQRGPIGPLDKCSVTSPQDGCVLFPLDRTLEQRTVGV